VAERTRAVPASRLWRASGRAKRADADGSRQSNGPPRPGVWTQTGVTGAGGRAGRRCCRALPRPQDRLDEIPRPWAGKARRPRLIAEIGLDMEPASRPPDALVSWGRASPRPRGSPGPPQGPREEGARQHPTPSGSPGPGPPTAAANTDTFPRRSGSAAWPSAPAGGGGGKKKAGCARRPVPILVIVWHLLKRPPAARYPGTSDPTGMARPTPTRSRKGPQRPSAQLEALGYGRHHHPQGGTPPDPGSQRQTA